MMNKVNSDKNVTESRCFMSERVLGIGTRKHTQVTCLDEPGPGGACHEYIIQDALGDETFCEISFQNGPTKENGVNGCQNEDLLAIVIDRLEHFQKGEYACEENEAALGNVRQTMANLRARTDRRKARGVEGTSEK